MVVSVSSYRTQYGSTAFYNELNANGELVVSKSYLDSLNRILCYHAIYLDSNILMCGTKNILKDSIHNAYVAKLNSNFDTIWTKEYPSIEQRNFPSFGKIIKTKSGHICMVGVDNQNNSATDPNRNNAMIKLIDNNGNDKNLHYLPKKYPRDLETYNSVVEDSYGYLYACGLVIAFKNIPFIVKYDQNGNFIWRKEYEDPSYCEGFADGKLLKDGSLIFTGTRLKLFTAEDWQQFITTIDTAGNVIFKKIFLGGYKCETKHCVQDDSENLICAGQIIETIQSKGSKAWLIKFSYKGDSIWEKRYESNWSGRNARFENISKSSDGGYYLTGVNWIPENNSGRAWVVKTDSNGCIIPGCTTDFITEREPHKDLFLLSPNPTEDYVNVYINDAEFYDRKYDLYLYDQQGRIVQRHVVQGRVTQVDLSSLSAGMYYYRIVDERNKVRQSGKVVVNG
ncbi:MAG: T9SS type A sorting domain-containing protein [Saprospiraceae bacterium]|nr:T9SS type A sorting domain-containing protein [Saprospiraceae bacterium]